MPHSTYRITPKWKDLVSYDEGDGRVIDFDAGNMSEPFYVSVPAAAQWKARTPAWAHERREIILERLRGAKCVVEEVDADVRTITSPDGSFRVELWYENDYPAPPRHSIRIVATEGNMTLVNLDGAYMRGVIAFPSPGEVILPITLNRNHHQLGIDVVRRTFWTHPTDVQPMDDLPAWLASACPTSNPRPQSWRPAGRRETLWTFLSLFVCLIFVVAGVWMVCCGATARDRWMGGLSAVFFGLCACAPLLEHRRKRPPP